MTYLSEYYAVVHIHIMRVCALILSTSCCDGRKNVHLCKLLIYLAIIYSFCIRALSLKCCARRGEWKNDDGECFLRRAANWNDDELRESAKKLRTHAHAHTHNTPPAWRALQQRKMRPGSAHCAKYVCACSGHTQILVQLLAVCLALEYACGLVFMSPRY